MPNEAELLRAQVERLCHAIPHGRVISYGALGARCEPPISGYVCGRVMGRVMDVAPWWRVVGKTGNLPIHKKGPERAREQRELLESEGVEFADDTIKREFFEDEAPAEKPVEKPVEKSAQGELF